MRLKFLIRSRVRRVLSLALLLVLLIPSSSVAAGNPPPPPTDFLNTVLGAGGARSNGKLSDTQIHDAALTPPGAPESGGPHYEYRGTSACNDANPDSQAADANNCALAAFACQPPGGPGPLTRLWRRIVQADGSAAPWEQMGMTCFPDAVPGPRSPVVTMAMIMQAFRDTPWAQSQIETQPEGNVTLAGLETFYRASWSDGGYEPQEIHSFLLLGIPVDIRVKLVNVMWNFGDGQSFGPTTSLGGMYPSGNISHKYVAGGAYPATTTTTFSGDFRINGSEWAPIPSTVAVPGPATAVTVRTAEAQLVSH